MFDQQVIWITGASSGIGEALALQFAAAGARLVLSSRRDAELQRVRAACLSRGRPDADVLVLPLDVTNHAAMPGAVARVTETFGRIDMLINNAGISQRSLCIDTSLEVYRQILEVDVLGQIALTREVLPLFQAQGSGHIVIIASVTGKVGVPWRTGYAAAKHAMMGFADSLRAEVAALGIRVTTVTPGFIRTAISQHALRGDGSEFGRVDADIAGGMDVDRCAEHILRGLRRGKPEIAVGDGKEMHVLWLKRLAPNAVFRLMAKMARRA